MFGLWAASRGVLCEKAGVGISPNPSRMRKMILLSLARTISSITLSAPVFTVINHSQFCCINTEKFFFFHIYGIPTVTALTEIHPLSFDSLTFRAEKGDIDLF